MKKLTKIGAGLLLSATMLSSAFADEITMWTMEEQPDRMARQQQIAADFNAATGHTVNVVAVTEKDIATRATAAFAAGELPDVLKHTVRISDETSYKTGDKVKLSFEKKRLHFFDDAGLSCA